MKGKGIRRKITERRLHDVKINVQYRHWDKQQGYLFTVFAASGV
jgi:hypothetical protein